MKSLLLVLSFASMFLAVLCEPEEDPFFSTDFVIQNDSSEDLIIVTAEQNEFVLLSQTSQSLFFSTNETKFTKPSENATIANGIKLYQKDENDNLVIVYEQNPIDDDQWIFIKQYTHGGFYNLVITDADLDL